MQRRVVVGLCLLLLLIQTVIQVRLASLDSPTTDEAVHVSAGYTYLTRGDFRFNPEHPPLVKMLAAVPLLFIHPKLSPDAEPLWQRAGNIFYDSWRENRRFGEIFMYESGNNPDQMIFAARLPMILLTLALGLVVFFITLRHFGAPGALVSTALYTFNPTVNGHGHLVTTDIGLALGYLLASYFLWQFIEKPTVKSAVVFGLGLALALLSKHTAIIFLPAVVIVIGWVVLKKRIKISEMPVKLLLVILTAIIAIWLGFGFKDRTAPYSASISTETKNANIQLAVTPESQANLTNSYEGLDKIYTTLYPILKIFPGNYTKGLIQVIVHASGGHDSFLLGQTSKEGWWYYFPVLILLKTPIPELLIIFGAIYILLRHREPDSLVIILSVSAGIFFLSAILSKADLGLRHIMPVMPILFILCGTAVNKSTKLLKSSLLLLAWAGIIFVVTFPGYLGYFNELDGGSRNGYKIATDSNLDWGQDLKRIASYVKVNHINQPQIEYAWLGNSALDYYLGRGNYKLLSEMSAGTGPVIINASALYEPQYKKYLTCPGQTRITYGVFLCP